MLHTLHIVRGCYVEFDGRDITVVNMLSDIKIGDTTGHPLKLVVDYAALVGQRVDAQCGPYGIAARVKNDDHTVIIGIEVVRPGKLPLQFYLEPDIFELQMSDLKCDDADERAPEDGEGEPATS